MTSRILRTVIRWSMVLLPALAMLAAEPAIWSLLSGDSLDIGKAEAREKSKKKKKKKGQQEEPQPAGGAAAPAAGAQQQSADELDQLLKQGKEKKLIDIALLTIPADQDVKSDDPVLKKINQTIAKLLGILKDYQDGETLRRLAEHYSDKAKKMNLALMGEHSKKMDSWFQSGQKGEPPKEPDPELWNRFHRKAVNICKLVLERYPQYENMDEVHFFMASSLREIGEGAEGCDHYKKLVEKFPNSSYAPDAWMGIGDYYFANNNVYGAIPAFEKVLEFKNSKVWGYAKYKLAWCQYNLGEYKLSIKLFQEVVEWSEKQEKGPEENKGIQLKEESLRDLVMSYADQEGIPEAEIVREAEEYFMKVGGKKYFRMMLVRLGEILVNQGKLEGAIMVYRRLIQEYPLAKENPQFQMHIVDAYVTKGDKDATTKEIIKLVDYAKPEAESEWVKANLKKEPEAVQDAWNTAERMLIKTVVDYHKESIKINREETWELTQKLYDTFLTYFAKSAEVYNVSHNYAELLWKRAENVEKFECMAKNFVGDKDASCTRMLSFYKKAGDWYYKVTQMDTKGKWFEESSYAGVLCFEKVVHNEIKAWMDSTIEKSKRKDKGYKLEKGQVQAEKEKTQAERCAENEKFVDENQPRPMSENVQAFVRACNVYIDNIPQSQYKVDIIYKVAIIHYSHNNFGDGVDRFELIVKDYPQHKLAEYSANLILDSLNLKRILATHALSYGSETNSMISLVLDSSRSAEGDSSKLFDKRVLLEFGDKGAGL